MVIILLTLGARTSRPHSVQSTLNSFLPVRRLFTLRAQCGRDVRAPSETEPPLRLQSLLDVRDNVIHTLDADRDPNQPIRDSQLPTPRRRQIPMRSSRRMQHAGKNIAQTGRSHTEL